MRKECIDIDVVMDPISTRKLKVVPQEVVGNDEFLDTTWVATGPSFETQAPSFFQQLPRTSGRVRCWMRICWLVHPQVRHDVQCSTVCAGANS